MKILHVPHIFLPHIGGVESYSYRTARDLVLKGEDCEVVAPSSSGHVAGREKYDQLQVTYLPAINFFSRSPYLIGLKAYLNKLKPQLVHIHSIWFFSHIQICLFKKRFNYKIINTVHGVMPDQAGIGLKLFLILMKPMAQYIVNQSDRIIVLTEEEKKKLVKTFKVDQAKIAIIGNGIDEVRVGDKTILKIKARVDKPYLLFTGRIIPEKNPDLLIKAFGLIKKKFSDLQVVMLGSCKEDYMEELLNSAGDFKERVMFYGALHPVIDAEEIAGLYKLAKLSVAVGSWEGLPTRMLESMIQKVPAVAYASGGVRDVINDKQNGFMIEELNENELVQKIEYYLGLSSQEQDTIRSNAYNSARDYLWKKKFDEIYRIYKSIYNTVKT